MKSIRLLYLFVSVMGAIAVGLWLVIDIYGTEKINPFYATIGLILMLWGQYETERLEIIEIIDESKAT